jgi:hypothetical protein
LRECEEIGTLSVDGNVTWSSLFGKTV